MTDPPEPPQIQAGEWLAAARAGILGHLATAVGTPSGADPAGGLGGGGQEIPDGFAEGLLDALVCALSWDNDALFSDAVGWAMSFSSDSSPFFLAIAGGGHLLVPAVPRGSVWAARIAVRVSRGEPMPSAAVIPDAAAAALSDEFDGKAGAEWISRYPGTAHLLVSAVADETDGSVGAIGSLALWMTDAQRFPPSWIAAVETALSQASALAG